ncbi:hypothetical protein EV175_004197 [Coemansia sp. RSA 1933]|nr:hypothetical protein EV175_004197 [Coemansia sp. RSA 1933]
MSVFFPKHPLLDLSIVECRASEELAHENGCNYVSKSSARMHPPPRFQKSSSALPFNGSSGAAARSRVAVLQESSSAMPMPVTRPHTATAAAASATDRVQGREVAEKLLCRNSLFTNAVKQQSRCMSVLLQQGSHGGIRRIGPLLITTERGGSAIKHLNPAFIDMVDVQPVDKGSITFLKKSNIRRRSFSMPPGGPGNDWLDTLTDIIGASKSAKDAKQGADHVSSSGPGMWWPLNDDNCSDEVSYDVHIASLDNPDAASRDNRANGISRHHGLERTGSSTTIASTTSLKPQSSRGAGRKGSVSSQLRLMARPETSAGTGGGSYLNSSNATRQHNVSYNGFVVQQQQQPPPPPTLPHSVSADASESAGLGSRTPQSGSSANMQIHSFTNQLADVTMKTESGLITRSVKCVSLRVLVNRLASPEGNVDSDLMTDFLNSYRFFAHPIDVMRLIIVRYLNCFDNDAISNEIESSDADDADSSNESDSKYLTINGWKSNCNGNGTSSLGTNGDNGGGNVSNGDQKPQQPATAPPPASDSQSKQLPLLVRNDGAIVQLRVMNIVKYWIKYHPHDFRLHHRLTRLLLLFLSHIQKQPGRADFVNAIRQKLSSGRLLAVEMPAFASSTAAPATAQSTAVPSQASSIRSSCIPTPTIESARSAIDLQSSGFKRVAAQQVPTPVSAGPQSRIDYGGIQGHQPNYQLYAESSGNGASLRNATDISSAFSVPVQSSSSSRPPTVKKGSTSYFRSLFQSRSSKNNSASNSSSNVANMESGGHTSDSESYGAYGSNSIRASQRGDNTIYHHIADLSPAGDVDEHGLRIPNGNMYASDFGVLVMEALAKSGVPTPQTPVGRTLLNYSIANRNPYRINLVGIDPATFAEQLTLLEHELFSRISATEFSLKGRVGNLETILHTMQGAAVTSGDSRNSASTLAGGQQAPQPGQFSLNNPVPSLTAMTSWFNQATYWTVLSVLSEPTTSARALVVKQLIHVALHCLARRNYYGAFEIVIALDNSAVRRLHDTWALVPDLMREIVALILEVLQSRMNFRTYRESLKAALSGASGPDEEIFNVVAEQIKIARAKDMIAASSAHANAAMSAGSSNGHAASSSGSGFGNLVHGALFGGDDARSHSRKKSNVPASASISKNGPLLTEQDCACITYAIRIRAASFMYFDPSAGTPGDGSSSKHGSAGSSSGGGYSSAPAFSSSKSGRGSAAHMSSGSSKSGSSALSGTTMVGTGGSGSNSKHMGEGGDPNDSRYYRARSTSNGSGGGMFGGKNGGSGFKQGQMITNGAPLPIVPFIAVHMTDLFHADQANATYSEEHQKMRSRNPTGPDSDANSRFMPQLPAERPPSSRRQMRCDSTAISNVNQAQPLLNMQKFRLITTMFRELHLAQRTKYPYAADVALQQQIHSAVRNIKAQVNDISAVVEDIVTDDPTLLRPATSYSSPFARARTDSSASRTASDGMPESADQSSFGYPLYQTSSLQKNQASASLFDTSMDWDFADLKDNQELEQRLYMLSKWVEPSSNGLRR